MYHQKFLFACIWGFQLIWFTAKPPTFLFSHYHPFLAFLNLMAQVLPDKPSRLTLQQCTWNSSSHPFVNIYIPFPFLVFFVSLHIQQLYKSICATLFSQLEKISIFLKVHQATCLGVTHHYLKVFFFWSDIILLIFRPTSSRYCLHLSWFSGSNFSFVVFKRQTFSLDIPALTWNWAFPHL